MAVNRNAEIKDYICQTFVKEDDALLAAKSHSVAEGLPNIAIPENVGQLLYIFVKMQKPKKILEVGTLAGYSTLWLAKGAPEATIITLEHDPKHAKVACDNFRRTTLGNNINLVEGDASETLKRFIREGESPFDMIFLDADKEGYPEYLPLLIALSRPGTLLLTDNLIPKDGEINEPRPKDQIAFYTYRYNELIASHPQLDSILLTTIVGDNGRVDALGISIVG